MATSNNFAKQWFDARGWKPFAFQKQVWAAVKRGESGLLHASTGAGKTYAVWFAALNRFARLACFRLGSEISLLPAFGAFTGGYRVEQDNDCRILVIGDNEVWPVN